MHDNLDNIFYSVIFFLFLHYMTYFISHFYLSSSYLLYDVFFYYKNLLYENKFSLNSIRIQREVMKAPKYKRRRNLLIIK